MKKTALTTSILFAFGVAGAAGTAMAETDEPLEEQTRNYEDWKESNNVRLFKVLDDDGDGFLTRDEVSDYAEIDNLFPSLDKDGDDELSNEEFGEYNPSTGVIDQAEEELNSGMNN